MYCIERSVNNSITRILRVNNIFMLLLALHMLTFRLMVTMVAEFCSLVTLIHIAGRDNDQYYMNYMG